MEPHDDNETQEIPSVEPESGINLPTVLISVGVAAVVAALIVTIGLTVILVLHSR
jgi:hypothetical protein